MGQDQADTVPGQRFSSIETVVLPKGVSVNENNGQPEARYDIDNEQMHLSNPTSPEPDTQGTAITESSGNGQCFCNPCQYATLTQSANQAENVPARIISFCSNNGSGETPWDPNMLPKAGDFCRMLGNVDEESPSTRYTQAYTGFTPQAQITTCLKCMDRQTDLTSLPWKGVTTQQLEDTRSS